MYVEQMKPDTKVSPHKQNQSTVPEVSTGLRGYVKGMRELSEVMKMSNSNSTANICMLNCM